MTNKFYAADEQHGARVRELFATIAPRYDLINDLQSLGLHRFWKGKLNRLAAGQRGERALDLCCGTGDIALAFARQGLETIGLDFSGPMLAVAEQRAQVLNTRFCATAPVRFMRGDAQQIPFPDESFDIVTMAYGLRNLADWDAGLREMLRVAKPGARLLVLDFGKPDNRLWRAVYFGYLRWCVPVLGKVFCGDADTHGYILESLRHYVAQRGVARRMRQLELRNVRIYNLAGGTMSINYGEKPRQ